MVEPHRSGSDLLAFGFEVEDFRKFERYGTVIRIRWHQLAHVRPPVATNIRLGDGGPLSFARKLNVGEELTRLGMEKDGVSADAVFQQRGLQLGPDGLVTTLILCLAPGVNGHDERFADHGCA